MRLKFFSRVARAVVASRLRGVSARWSEEQKQHSVVVARVGVPGCVVSSGRVPALLRDPRNPAENHEYASLLPVLRTSYPKFESTTG